MWYLCSHISRAEYHDHNITNVGRKWEFISHKKHFSWFLENIWEGIFGEAPSRTIWSEFILSEQYFRLFELLMANKQSVESTLSKVKKHHCSLSYRFEKNNKTWLHCLHSCQLPRDIQKRTKVFLKIYWVVVLKVSSFKIPQQPYPGIWWGTQLRWSWCLSPDWCSSSTPLAGSNATFSNPRPRSQRCLAFSVLVSLTGDVSVYILESEGYFSLLLLVQCDIFCPLLNSDIGSLSLSVPVTIWGTECHH